MCVWHVTVDVSTMMIQVINPSLGMSILSEGISVLLLVFTKKAAIRFSFLFHVLLLSKRHLFCQYITWVTGEV